MNAQNRISSHDELLSPRPLPLETGIRRLDDGRLLVAVRTELPGCAGRMLEWWFKFFETTQHIRWWHPHDHHRMHGWDKQWRRGESYVGACVRAEESLGDFPPVTAALKFHEPGTFSRPTRWRRQDASRRCPGWCAPGSLSAMNRAWRPTAIRRMAR
ncbi:Uncharacterised protein [Chromobacterium violaceum]|uniref:DAPG hydrolase PhiG domain-containing protein n=1 Tax=Chromobacterium violaceum TaxID=536 RepID=A0A3S4IZR0_CHRVL|nr:Uncharacterised protein [Chromobacterium violaceum]